MPPVRTSNAPCHLYIEKTSRPIVLLKLSSQAALGLGHIRVPRTDRQDRPSAALLESTKAKKSHHLHSRTRNKPEGNRDSLSSLRDHRTDVIKLTQPKQELHRPADSLGAIGPPHVLLHQIAKLLAVEALGGFELHRNHREASKPGDHLGAQLLGLCTLLRQE